jgi:peptidoglycan/LPS O-acetylase OafA/YrhL
MKAERSSFEAVRLLAALAAFWYLQIAALGGGAVQMPLAERMSLGEAGVLALFAITGFLLTASLRRDDRPVRCIRAGILRIYPAFVVCLLFCIVAGALVTTESFGAYFGSWETGRFFLGNAAIFAAHTPLQLPGVFGDAPWPVVDTPLYVLRYGLLLCGALLAIFCLPIVKRLRRPLLLGLMIAAVVVGLDTPASDELTRFTQFDLGLATQYGLAFTIGACAAFLRHRPARSPRMLLALLAALATLAVTDLGAQADYVVSIVAISTLALVLGSSRWPARLVRTPFGDLSYGIYLFGFVIQQLVLTQTTSLPDYGIAILSFLLTIAVGVLSWRLVEAPALGLNVRLDQGAGAPTRAEVGTWTRERLAAARAALGSPGVPALVAACAVALLWAVVGSPQQGRLWIGAVSTAVCLAGAVVLVVQRRRTQGRWLLEPPTMLVAVMLVWHLGFWIMYYLGLAGDYRRGEFLPFTPFATSSAFFAVLVGTLAAVGGTQLGLGRARLQRPARPAGPGTWSYVLAAFGMLLVIGYAATAGRHTIGDYSALFTKDDAARRLYNLGIVLVLTFCAPVLLLERSRRRLGVFEIVVIVPTILAAAVMGSRWVLFSALAISISAISVRGIRVRVLPAVAALLLVIGFSAVVKQVRSGKVDNIGDVPAALVDAKVNPVFDIPQEAGQTYLTLLGTIASLERQESFPTELDRQWGSTYVGPLLTVVPSAEKVVGVDLPRPSKQFAQTYYPKAAASQGFAMGFSFLAELALNFGIPGVLIGSGLLFFVLARLYRLAMQREDLALTFVVWSLSTFAIFGIRNDAYTTIRWAVWGAIAAYLAGRLIASGKDLAISRWRFSWRRSRSAPLLEENR